MSYVQVSDKSGGVYQATIEFTYGECERLPYNILRGIGAMIETVPNAGVKAFADFNIRLPEESASFLEILDMFGEDGSFPHGSAADAQALAQTVPPGADAADADDDDLELEGTLGNAN